MSCLLLHGPPGWTVVRILPKERRVTEVVLWFQMMYLNSCIHGMCVETLDWVCHTQWIWTVDWNTTLCVTSFLSFQYTSRWEDPTQRGRVNSPACRISKHTRNLAQYHLLLLTDTWHSCVPILPMSRPPWNSAMQKAIHKQWKNLERKSFQKSHAVFCAVGMVKDSVSYIIWATLSMHHAWVMFQVHIGVPLASSARVDLSHVLELPTYLLHGRQTVLCVL